MEHRERADSISVRLRVRERNPRLSIPTLKHMRNEKLVKNIHFYPNTGRNGHFLPVFHFSPILIK